MSTSRTTKTRRRQNGLLLVAVAVALATASVVYGHWAETLTVDAQVITGTAGLTIVNANTDDDGVHNGWEGTTDNGLDPAEWSAASRYNADVASCVVTNQGVGGSLSTIAVTNGYPSYWCTIRQTVRNSGTVPLKYQAARVYACGPGVDCSNFPTNFVEVPYSKATHSFRYDRVGGTDWELSMVHTPNHDCGFQRDPGEQWSWRAALHFEQGAEQSAEYAIRFVHETVNWNEWSLSACYGFRNAP